jgi:hypothetical protein
VLALSAAGDVMPLQVGRLLMNHGLAVRSLVADSDHAGRRCPAGGRRFSGYAVRAIRSRRKTDPQLAKSRCLGPLGLRYSSAEMATMIVRTVSATQTAPVSQAEQWLTPPYVLPPCGKYQLNRVYAGRPCQVARW